MSVTKKIAARLAKLRRQSLKRRQKINSTNLFGFERLEDRQLLAADFLAGEILVQFDPAMSEEMRAEARPAGATLIETIHTAMMKRVGEGVLERIQLSSSMTVFEGIEYLENQGGVKFAEPNYIVTAAAVSNDARYTNGSLWGMYSDDTPTAIGPAGTTNAFGSQAEKVWDQDIIGSSNVIVGVIDEGIQFDHPDLINNMWVNPFDPIDGNDNDGNGFIDDTHGWDFFFGDRTVFDGADDDHGTHVAGTIGAEGGNSIGVAGVNWDVTMISLKFLGPDGGSTSGAIQAVDYLTDLKVRHGLNIVASNNSWGGGGRSTALHAAIIRSVKNDILFVAAAGNSGRDNDVTDNFPSNYNTLESAGSETAADYDGVIAVANITSTGAKAGSSQFGATTVDLGAPGSGIWSTVPGNSYASFSGTSMASPHVAGAVALYKSHYPDATGEEIRRILLQTAAPTPSMNGITVTGGRLDVAAMLAEPPLPLISITNESVAEGDSGTTQMTFTVSLSKTSTDTITVDYATRGDSATADVDYVSTSGTLTFAPGETEKTITVDVIGDTDVELREEFFVDLSNADKGIIGFPFGIGVIVSEDVPDISVSDVSIVEGNSGYRSVFFTVTLSDVHSENVTIAYSSEDGTARAGGDYQGVSGTLIIPAGAIRGTVRVNVIGDTVIEANETFFLNLLAADQGNLINATGTATIINDDSEQGLTISDSVIIEGNTGRRNMFFTVELAQPSRSFVTIYYATRNGSATSADRDYIATSGQVSIRPGAQSATIAIPVLGDRKIEGDENFFVQLVRAFGAVITDGLAEGIIFNDDVGRFIPAPPPTTGFSSLAETLANQANLNANGFSNALAPAATSSSATLNQPSSIATMVRERIGPRFVRQPSMSEYLPLSSRIGPKLTESFAASVDLALVALLRDGERLP